MTRINVSKVVNNPKFAQNFIVHRKVGHWEKSRFVQTESEISFYGTITAMNPKDLVQVPEADRVTGMMCFHCEKEIFGTRDKNGIEQSGTSDEIIWRKERYRIVSTVPWTDFGYMKAFGVRMVSK